MFNGLKSERNVWFTFVDDKSLSWRLKLKSLRIGKHIALVGLFISFSSSILQQTLSLCTLNTHVCVYMLVNHYFATVYKHKLNSGTDTHTCKLTFLTSKTSCSLFCHWNWKPQYKQHASCLCSTTCSLPDQGSDTQSLPSLFPSSLSLSGSCISQSSSHGWCFWLVLKLDPLDKTSCTHGAC